ncbi:acyl-phosphate glycerol-3-phosphate acyltransferase [Tranquillimonas rosea]|uniref:Glycerol-3-phosphate acyltransferase n=1 Tax=Tranquillimonas rosea TaxID=641238 RepID=A0A1H9SFY0_9RHOB|nr:glycerol-3-phosphate 1-O-acyltransferase PlsY [Tranquillimonas rosea]SER83515.1 acyl-phosphate glycerol-3-phosphate acyltransferase [Tranquillimonas rosea]
MLILVAVLAYLLGSISFGFVMARLFGLGDLRQIGSGNPGATNVLRTGNKLAAFLTLVLDAGKGAIAVIAARLLLGETAAQVAGFAAFAGHCYPVFTRFLGGKGVATFLGTALALSWPVGLISCALWIGTAALLRISSLSALVSAALTPVAAFALGRSDLSLLLALLAVLVFWRHRGNIVRLARGIEPKIGK